MAYTGKKPVDHTDVTQSQSMTVTDDLTVDTSTLHVDSANNRVGIGTSSPDNLVTIFGGDSGHTWSYDGGDLLIIEDNDSASINIATPASNSGNILFSDAGARGQGRIAYTHSSDKMEFMTGGISNTRMAIDSSGNVGIGTTSPNADLHISSALPDIRLEDSDDGSEARISYNTAGNNGLIISADEGNEVANSVMAFKVDATERMRIDSSGSVLIGNKTGLSDTGAGHAFAGSSAHGLFYHRRDGALVGSIMRGTSYGDILRFVDANGSNCGFIRSVSAGRFALMSGSGAGYLGLGSTYYYSWNATEFRPQDDNLRDLGASSLRWDDVRATNGTIQTSDQNEKQQIASLTAAEITAAKAISKLFKTFKWNDKVEAKGDAARTHTGVVAQEVQSAMTDAGLDAADYAFWCLDTWWETQTEVPAVEAVEAQDAVYDDDGNLVTEAVEAVEAKDAYTRTDTFETADDAPEGATERTRLGIRYPELLAFVGAATEQRLADIETRLTALEAN